MSYDRLTDAEIESGAFTLASTAKKIQSNQDFFAGQIGTLAAIQLSNGSFEIASDAAQPNLPDNWNLARYANGVFVLDTTNPRHGAKIAKFTHPGGAGNGGGQLISDFFECSPDLLEYILGVTFWTTIVGVRIQIIAQYFNSSQVSLGADETLYTADGAGTGPSPGNQTSATRRLFALTVPATARYLKIKLVGGATAVDPGASTDIYFDQVAFTFAEIGSPARIYGTGSKIIAASDAAETSSSASYVKLKEIEIVRQGNLTVDFDLRDDGAGTVFGRIYKNGVAVGTERSTGLGSYQSYSEDFAGLFPGDLIQLYVKIASAGVANVQNFRALNAFYEVATATD